VNDSALDSGPFRIRGERIAQNCAFRHGVQDAVGMPFDDLVLAPAEGSNVGSR
jgi:hypothetical protein